MALPDELAEEVLLRLPTDEPEWLLRASLVCKPWRSLISHRNFLSRLYEHHRTPPVLGFFHSVYSQRTTRLIPTTAFSVPVPVPDGLYWYALDYHHGRALFCAHGPQNGRYLLVWEPITGHQLLLWMPEAPFHSFLLTATVVCAVDGCGHRDCHGGPFRLVYVFRDVLDYSRTYVRVYSSETSTWGNIASVDLKPTCSKPGTIVGKYLLYFLFMRGRILEYDLITGQGLAVINLPNALTGNVVLMPTKEGGLGAAGVKDVCLHLWSRKVGDDGEAGWVQSRIIRLDNMLPIAAIGFAEEANVIFVNTSAGIFAVELESERVRKVSEAVVRNYNAFIPFTSFYIPGIQVGTDAEVLEEGADVLQQAAQVGADAEVLQEGADVLQQAAMRDQAVAATSPQLVLRRVDVDADGAGGSDQDMSV